MEGLKIELVNLDDVETYLLIIAVLVGVLVAMSLIDLLRRL